jgi:hypothetical protein
MPLLGGTKYLVAILSGDGCRIGADHTGGSGVDVYHPVGLRIDDEDAGGNGVQNLTEPGLALAKLLGGPDGPQGLTAVGSQDGADFPVLIHERRCCFAVQGHDAGNAAKLIRQGEHQGGTISIPIPTAGTHWPFFTDVMNQNGLFFGDGMLEKRVFRQREGNESGGMATVQGVHQPQTVFFLQVDAAASGQHMLTELLEQPGSEFLDFAAKGKGPGGVHNTPQPGVDLRQMGVGLRQLCGSRFNPLFQLLPIGQILPFQKAFVQGRFNSIGQDG